MHKKEERGWSGYKGGWSDFRPSIFKTYRKQLLNNHHLAGLLIYPIDFEDLHTLTLYIIANQKSR